MLVNNSVKHALNISGQNRGDDALFPPVFLPQVDRKEVTNIYPSIYGEKLGFYIEINGFELEVFMFASEQLRHCF